MSRPSGLPSTNTTAAPARSSAWTTLLTVSPEPTVGSGGDMWPLSGSSGRARRVISASSRSRSTMEPTTSAALTGGSSFTTGSWDTSYSRSRAMAWATVSPGCACTNSGISRSLRPSTSLTSGSPVCADRNP